MNFLARLASCLPVTLLTASFLTSSPAAAVAQVLLPRTGISADELALIINDDDPLSRQIGEYYRKARHIPEANVIHLHFPPGRSALAKDEFAQLKRRSAAPRRGMYRLMPWPGPAPTGSAACR